MSILLMGGGVENFVNICRASETVDLDLCDILSNWSVNVLLTSLIRTLKRE